MQKYVLVKLLEKKEEGAEFAAPNWPLHITVVANFAVDWDGNNLSEKLQALLADQIPMELNASNDAYFGPRRDVRVTVLHESDDLLSFHKKLIALLKDAGAVFDEPQYLEDGYRAHVTVQKNIRLEKGDRVLLDDLSIIDMFPRKDIGQRKLIKTFNCSGKY